MNFSRTMDDVMEMMQENDDGNMEFPRDLMVEDCFSPAEEPLYGFVTNVTVPEDMLEPCLVNVECFENGTSINATRVNNDQNIDNTTLSNSDQLTLPPILKKQGIVFQIFSELFGAYFILGV